eukprot:COSAG02_NODE_4529_length_5254_cov_2.860524_1_plen_288_part_00
MIGGSDRASRDPPAERNHVEASSRNEQRRAVGFWPGTGTAEVSRFDARTGWELMADVVGLKLLACFFAALASGARAQASCDVTGFVLPSNVGIDSCDGLVCETDATGTTTCSGTVAHAATCTLKCAPPGALPGGCQRGDACTTIDSDDIRTAGPPELYDLDGDGVADLLDADIYPNAPRGVEHPWLLSGDPPDGVVSVNTRDGGLVQPSCANGVFETGSVACTSCPTVEHAQWYGCGYRQNQETAAWNWLTEGASCSMGSYLSDSGEFAGAFRPLRARPSFVCSAPC